MKITPETIIGDVVAADYRAAQVFSRHGIDFCCKGNISIAESCSRKNLDTESLVSDLTEITATIADDSTDYRTWDADLLADFIEKKHHRYIRETGPILSQYLDKVSVVHGDRHPEAVKVAESFRECLSALDHHMMKEEQILFPYIRAMATSQTPAAPFGSVDAPINMMRQEHDIEGERFREISELTNGYTPPDDACNTYRVSYSMLKEFEADLHRHIHLENNILFPKAQALEGVAQQ